jgi:antirestriction protein ArdC
MKQDMYETVTNKVLEMMEAHGTDWINPFARKGKSLRPINVASKKAYRGINVLLLGWMPYTSPVWGTYNQWNQRDCTVRKGEKATDIVFWNFVEKDDPKTGEKVKIPFLRNYKVFNAEQVEGDVAAALTADPVEDTEGAEEIVSAEGFFRRIPANIQHSDKGMAYYSPAADLIHMPNKAVFEATPTSTATECYYSTLAHELTHWTGAKHRLARLTMSSFGSEEYAREELVAEIGAALLCAHLEISASPRPDHAKYLNGWIKKLSDSKREFVSAASAAAKAVDFILDAAKEEVAVAA